MDKDEIMTPTDDKLARVLAEADALYEASMREEDDGLPIDPATISMPNFAKSKIVRTRLAAQEYEALVEIATEKDTSVSSVLSAAVTRYLQAREAGEQR
jgi:hypothetical protein